MYCRRCGKELKEGQLFCTACGMKVSKPAESSLQETDSQQAGKQVCSYCGSTLKENAKFCTKCGKPIRRDPALDRENAPEESVKPEKQRNIEQKRASLSEQDKRLKKSQKMWIAAGIIVVLIILIMVVLLFIWKDRTSGNVDNTMTEERSTIEQTTQQETVTTEEASTTEESTTEATEASTTETVDEEVRVIDEEGSYRSDKWCGGYKMYVPDGFVLDREEDNLTGFVDDNEGTYLIWGACRADSTSEEGLGYYANGKDFFDNYVTGDVSYSRVEDDYCCYSYADENGMIYYHAYHFDKKMMYGFELHYDEAYKEDYDSVVEELSSYVIGNKGRRKKIKSVDTTSVLQSQEGKTYSGSNLVDGNVETAWAEGVAGVGIGESITLHLKKATEIHEIDLLNGYFASADLYDKNGKVSRVRVDLGNGHVKEENLFVYVVGDVIEQDLAMQMYSGSIEWKEPVTTDTITITILDAETGDEHDDTCISEIEVY